MGSATSEAPVMTVNVSAEKNSKGYNYSATIVNAPSVEEAVEALARAMDSLARQYGGGSV